MFDTPADSLQAWIDHYLKMAVRGVRSELVTRKITLHLTRFQEFFEQRYGQELISSCVKRDVVVWQQSLINQGLAPATINHHLASLSSFATWVCNQNDNTFSMGDPTKGIGEVALPPLEPRALNSQQVQSLKNLCDRLLPYYRLKGRQWNQLDEETPLRLHARPWRDRAIVFVLLSTGLRREELVNLNLSQVSATTAADLRAVRRARINGVKGKGKTQRHVFLSADARLALADYLEQEYVRDRVSSPTEKTPLFLSAEGIPDRSRDGRLSSRSINNILDQIGRWHDAELNEIERHISPLRPHDLRHTFAFQLAKATNADAFELERRLGHRSQRYIQRYTNPPEDVAASYIEEF
jgi:site-specific recombinase XerD